MRRVCHLLHSWLCDLMLALSACSLDSPPSRKLFLDAPKKVTALPHSLVLEW